MHLSFLKQKQSCFISIRAYSTTFWIRKSRKVLKKASHCGHALLQKGMLSIISPIQLEIMDLKSALKVQCTVIFVKIHFQIRAHCPKNWKIKFYFYLLEISQKFEKFSVPRGTSCSFAKIGELFIFCRQRVNMITLLIWPIYLAFVLLILYICAMLN